LRRVLLVRGARRRRHQERGLPHRPLRGGERAAAAPGGRRGRGRGRAGCAPRPHRQGLRRAEGGAHALPRPRGRARRRGQDPRRPPSVPARDRAPRRATQDGDRQDPALPAPAATMTDLGVGAKLRAAFELSPTILAVTALDDGRLIEVNDAFLRTTGYTREEIIGRPIPHVRLWVDPSLRERGLADLRAGRPVRDMEARFRTKSGEEIVAIANADLVDVDGQTCVLTALMDITARVRAEAALRESERRFAQAFNANPLPMTITDRDGRPLDVNDAALRHSGYTRDEWMARLGPELGVKRLDAEGRARDVEVSFRT